MNMKIGIIGCGNMGSVIARGAVALFGTENIWVCDRNKEKRDAVGIDHVYENPSDIVNAPDVVVIGVKPQSFNDLIEQVDKKFKDTLVVSIMAGISIEKIAKKTGSHRVVRAMPNLPMEVEQGVIAWVASDTVSSTEREDVAKFFEHFGTQIELKEESKIDAFSVICGCGPAYYFYLTELLQNKAMQLDFDKTQAKQMVEATFLGTAALFSKKGGDVREWRKAVSSKGGVTERAIESMKDGGIEQVISNALDSAIGRSQELGS
jgi:pyrroline-5-carboxylate reductase